jgi:hypothetical protein
MKPSSSSVDYPSLLQFDVAELLPYDDDATLLTFDEAPLLPLVLGIKITLFGPHHVIFTSNPLSVSFLNVSLVHLAFNLRSYCCNSSGSEQATLS